MTKEEAEAKAREAIDKAYWACIRLPTSRTAPIERCDCDMSKTDGCRARVEVITAALLAAYAAGAEGERAALDEQVNRARDALGETAASWDENGFGVLATRLRSIMAGLDMSSRAIAARRTDPGSREG